MCSNIRQLIMEVIEMSDGQITIGELRAEYSGHGSMLVKDWNKEVISGDDQWGILSLLEPLGR